MKILFYLPCVTDRHFEGIVAPLLKILQKEAEIHIVGPPVWRATGITERQILRCIGMPDLRWHIVSGEEHPSLRTIPADPAQIVDLVRDIAPDYSFVRSADVVTPSLFPGAVRFLQEVLVPPFNYGPRSGSALTLDGPRLYDHGFAPELDPVGADRLDEMFRPLWLKAKEKNCRGHGERADYLAQAGLPDNCRVIAFPLAVQTYNNFFVTHHQRISNARLIEDLASRLPDDFVLAITRHPVNIRPNPAIDLPPDDPAEDIEPVIARFGNKVKLITAPGPSGDITTSLFQHCDGAVICDSKAFALAAFFGKPVLRVSRFTSAPWLNAYTDIDIFLEEAASGNGRIADQHDCRRWFASHYANKAFAAQDPALTAADILDRVQRPVNPARWEASLAQVGC